MLRIKIYLYAKSWKWCVQHNMQKAGLSGKVLLKCIIHFSISFRWYCTHFRINFCTQICHPLAYGVHIFSKASVTAVKPRAKSLWHLKILTCITFIAFLRSVFFWLCLWVSLSTLRIRLWIDVPILHWFAILVFFLINFCWAAMSSGHFAVLEWQTKKLTVTQYPESLVISWRANMQF